MDRDGKGEVREMMIQQTATHEERRQLALKKLAKKRARDAQLHAEHNTAGALENMHSWTDARIRKSFVTGNIEQRYGSIARGNRHTGGPHKHEREIARRMRQSGAQ